MRWRRRRMHGLLCSVTRMTEKARRRMCGAGPRDAIRRLPKIHVTCLRKLSPLLLRARVLSPSLSPYLSLARPLSLSPSLSLPPSLPLAGPRFSSGTFGVLLALALALALTLVYSLAPERATLCHARGHTRTREYTHAEVNPYSSPPLLAGSHHDAHL